MYKVKYGLAPSIVDKIFKQKRSSYSLRNSDFDIPTFNTTNYGKHSLRYQGLHIWSPNIESFKNNIRKKDPTTTIAAVTFAILRDHLLHTYCFTVQLIDAYFNCIYIFIIIISYL